MEMNEYFDGFIAKKEKEIESLVARCDASEDIGEVRAIGKQIESIKSEIAEARAQKGAVSVPNASFQPMQAIASVEMKSGKADDDMEYRTAFKDYVQKGTLSPILKRANDRTVSGDLGVILPQTVINEIMAGVEKVYGQLYSRVAKTNIRGGVKYPIGEFSATFRRIPEEGIGSAPTDRQNGGAITGYVEFSYNIGEIRLAQSLLASILAVPAFESKLTETIVKEYVKAMDKEIMRGAAASMQCEGIITEAEKVSSRIPAANIIEFTAEDMADWKSWQTKLFAKIPLSMRAERPEFVMTPGTYEANIKTLADDENRPVYFETFNPVDGAERATFKGREVIFVEEDILGTFDDISVAEGSTDSPYFGMLWVPEKAYAINSNLEFSVKRYFDDERNEWVDKALVINDGKVLDGNFVYLLKKVASSRTDDDEENEENNL